MDNTILREQEILRLKEELSIRYNYLMGAILLLFTFIYFVIVKEKLFGYYCLVGAIALLTHVYLLNAFFPSLSLEKRVRGYLIVAPIYIYFIILYFWKCSIFQFCWLVPVPLGAYIFLGKREGSFFSVYTLFIAVAAIFTGDIAPLHSRIKSYENIFRYNDLLSFGFNIAIVYLLIYYKDKIREQELLSIIEKRKRITLPITVDEKEIPFAKPLFERIENEVVTNKHFINPEFNISMLSTILKISNNYISKSIRLQGYSNFNTYINSHRINYVKDLISKSNLEKVTLMYIYTEAGFTNQSTFNKVFKQFVGMTPSEYIQMQNIEDR
ncbi:AraC family transcriptional regulator [Chryseobacterium oranimense]|uniref:helix-turn-helix domain-containing protein n=1 Tax=Chryseobacterium oranimense TaxID=421058 RepID=UPI0021B0713F|nr:AraC family transcriptional regulator [Chryseobacterium oranimense]UWX61774.1 AraC family transcriptional regulator [Chryseobacterium oranimense]